METGAVRAVFSNRGARSLKSWKLKHYFDSKGAPIDMLPSAIQRNQSEAVLADAWRRGADGGVNGALFKAERRRARAGQQAGSITFEYRDAAGLAVTKTFELQAGGHPYVIKRDGRRSIATASRSG